MQYTDGAEFEAEKTEEKKMTPVQVSYTQKFPFQYINGALLYISIQTHLDIAYHVEVLSRFTRLKGTVRSRL